MADRMHDPAREAVPPAAAAPSWFWSTLPRRWYTLLGDTYGLGSLVMWLARRRPSLQLVPVGTIDSRVLFLDLRQLTALPYLFAGEIPDEQAEGALMSAVVGPGEVAVDIGAHLGWFATLLAERVGPAGRVFAFEPGCAALRMLRASAARYPQITVSPVALSDRAGTAELHVSRVIGNASLRAVPEEVQTEWCELDTLDAFLERQHAPAPVFVKCDVEGAEMEVLTGADRLLHSSRPPAWIIEMNPRAAQMFGYRPEDLVERFGRLPAAYRACRFDEAGRLVPAPPAIESIFNVVFIPRWLDSRVAAFDTGARTPGPA